MSQDKYNKRISDNKLFRIMAFVALIIIVALVITTFVTGITGSEYFMGFLVLSIIVPVLVYVILWIGRILYNSSNKDDEGQTEADNKVEDKE